MVCRSCLADADHSFLLTPRSRPLWHQNLCEAGQVKHSVKPGPGFTRGYQRCQVCMRRYRGAAAVTPTQVLMVCGIATVTVEGSQCMGWLRPHGCMLHAML
jgi:hypothetical protein